MAEIRGDHSSLVAKVTDSWQACHEFEPSSAEDSPCREAMHLKSVESLNVHRLVWYLGDVGSSPGIVTMVRNFRGPSPKALV
ncbi:hypothetical protein TNCV_3703901 [Trichonephila clavipes]|nr:hypothetical protein TNCV_3703901 [Trichonephila clavipes]